MIEYNKLVRDKIPQIIQEKGKECDFRVAPPGSIEYKVALRKKLLEEAQEFYEDPSVEELADVLEVIAAIQQAEEVTDVDIESARQEKNLARGAFADGIILERVL